MKIPHTAVALLTSLLFVCSAIAAPPPPVGSAPGPAAPQVSLLTQVLDLSPALALQFVKKFGEAAPDQHAAILAELIKRSTAQDDPQHPRAISVPAITVRHGERATVETIREYRYPTEFSNENGLAIPTAFETRNIGTTVEVQPRRAADGKTWEVTSVFQLVHLAETKIYGAGQFAAEQPIFSTRKLSATVTLTPGVPQFVGIVGPDPTVDKGSVEPVRVIILTATVGESSQPKGF
jgi:hypothetical protein